MNPFIKNLSIGAGGVGVTVAIYLAAITAGGYSGAILHHLEDIIQGNLTRVVVALNAPNWGIGTPLAAPQVSTIATSSNPTAASGLASSTPYTFAVAAIDGEGTTTLSSPVSITTDASNTQALPEDINLSWPAVVGAQGYAIFFATSSNATTFSQYFLASTTNGVPNTQYTFATSSGSLPGSYTRNTSTAFSNRIMADGSKSYFNAGPVGFGTSTPASSTPADINGYMRASRQGTSTECYAATAGVVFYNAVNKHEWGCDGTSWNKIF